MAVPKKAVPKKPAEAKKPKIVKGYIKAEGGIYIAKKDCTFGISFFKAGKSLKTKDGQIIPHHFVKKAEYKKMLVEQEEDKTQEEDDLT
ncbi:MAG: hypothetical protein E3J23_08690 [Candidatus Stahlbacteria bacterium]|nr:MAG: hypothetical protein E3J23_08690 [Candidatus Stahlbacteria bacterium]